MASLFKRISDVVSANINDLIDRVEDPEKMIKQIISEMEENIRLAKDEVVDAIASEKTLKRDVDKHRREADAWQKRARTALADGNEELAKTALVRKKEHDHILASLEPAYGAAVNTSASLKGQLRALEAKLDEAKRKRSSLVARQRAAQAREHLSNLDDRFSSGVAAHANFSRMEDRVADIEARSAAVVELYNEDNRMEREFVDVEIQVEVESELAELKKDLEKDSA